ncbi:Tma10p [Sugiyamaella lignohabitans]|uniref:Tma10p n=1 Tax=Sugiyamaella lignohabitans TaxID=796027 RepID=A0A167DE57_9ASCO|nr:Tma10p [Sugiyamaella lignohabitans]ANB12813.1 Tma10p [Sugiyamaella lignohabitans]
MARTTRSTSGSSEEQLPRFFAKNGHYNQDPNKVKKDGHGRGNWGKEGDEIEDLEQTGEFNFNHTRRRSNSTTGNHPDMNSQTKFDRNDEVFEEDF